MKMGVRYRKSINLGGGFRINLSGSGIGYSWGAKGYRITKTAKGSIRKTISIPGTGLSYTQEYGGTEHRPVKPVMDNNYYGTEDIVNTTATELVSDGLEKILSLARSAILINRLSTFLMIGFIAVSFVQPVSLLPFALSLGLKVYVKTAGRVNLEYDIDDDQQAIVAERMSPMLQAAQSVKVWRITQSSKVIDKKYAAGASNTVNRVKCTVSKKAPFPFRANTTAVSFTSGKETLIFLPDKLFLVQKNRVGALNYCDISVSTYAARFIEEEQVPKDAKIVGTTWQYVNKSGGPDRRFKNNRQLPICSYGRLELKSESGLNTVIMFSNSSLK